MFYLRLIALAIWVVIACALGTVLSFLRFGNIDNSRVAGRLIGFCNKIAGFKLEVQGVDIAYNHRPCIFACNHQSAFDVPIYGSFVPGNTVVVGKKELIYIPFFGLLFLAVGNLFIDRSNRRAAMKSLEKVSMAIRERSISVFIFPEGTRNREGRGLLPFKKGAFYMAIDAQVPVVPMVTMELAGIFNFKNRILKSGTTIKVRVLDPISTKGKTKDDVDQIMEECHQKMLQALREISSA